MWVSMMVIFMLAVLSKDYNDDDGSSCESSSQPPSSQVAALCESKTTDVDGDGGSLCEQLWL